MSNSFQATCFDSRRKISQLGAATLEMVLFGILAILGTFATVELGRYYYAKSQACEFAERAADKLSEQITRSYDDGKYTQNEFIADARALSSWADTTLSSHPRFRPPESDTGNDGRTIPMVNSYDMGTTNMLAILRSSYDWAYEGMTAQEDAPGGPYVPGGATPTQPTYSRVEHPEARGGTRYSPITPIYVYYEANHQPMMFPFNGLKSTGCGAYVSPPWSSAVMDSGGSECADYLYGVGDAPDAENFCMMMNSPGKRVCYWSEDGVPWGGFDCKCYCYGLGDGSYRGPVGEVPPDSGSSSSSGDPGVCPPCPTGHCLVPGHDTPPDCLCGPITLPTDCFFKKWNWDAASCSWSPDPATQVCPPGTSAAPYPLCCVPDAVTPGGGPPVGGGGPGGGPTTSSGGGPPVGGGGGGGGPVTPGGDDEPFPLPGPLPPGPGPGPGPITP